MLTINGLSVNYGGSIEALRDVSIAVPDRSVVSVLGSNGAGKSTLLRAISGTLPLHKGRVLSGSITYDGVDITKLRADKIVAQGLVQVPEGRHVFTDLTVSENLRAGSVTVKDKAKRRAAEARIFELFPILGERRDQKGGYMSGGEQQMLAIGRALMTEPKVLMLDEPSLGLAPLIVDRIGEVVKQINELGTSVLLIEQNASMALAVSSHAFVLELGRVSLAGTAAELGASDAVRELYLGKGGNDSSATAARVSDGSRRLTRWAS